MITIWFTKEELELMDEIIQNVTKFYSHDFSDNANSIMIDIRRKIIDRLK